MTKRKALTVLGLVIVLFFYVVFVVTYTISENSISERASQEHAEVVENALWSLDRHAPVNYLQLVCSYYDYDFIKVYDDTGSIFLEIQGPPLTGIDVWLDKAGLIPHREILTEIEHHGHHIGSLSVLRRVKHFYTYIEALGIAILLFVAYLFVLWISLAKQELKLRVKERTQDLEEEVEERRRAENELRRLRNYLANIIDSMPSKLVGVDAEGKITLWNKMAEQDTGLCRAEARGKHLSEVFPSMAAEMEFISDSLRTLEVSRFQKRSTSPEKNLNVEDITIYPLMTSGDQGAVIRMDNVTEEHRMREKIRASEEKFRLLFESSREAIMLLDLKKGIFDCNPEALKMLGAESKSEMFGKNLWDIAPELQPDGGSSKTMLEECIEKVIKEGSHQWEWIAMTLDGEEFPTAALVTKMELEGRVFLQGNLRDITEQKEMEARLRHSQKMEAVGELAGGIAHDFNNQLSGILGLADLIRYKVEGQSDLMQFADSIITSVNRASDIIAKLLAFSRKGKYLSTPIDMHRIVDEVVTLLHHSIDKKIAIKKELNAEPSLIIGDPSQLQNAILNIALNARDAMPEGGELVFSTQVVRRVKGEGSAPNTDSSGYFRLRIRDTGIGMDEETKRRIFDPFFTTKEQGKGTGMGLAAVYGAVENHRGFITVESAPGEGTVFDLRLPLAPEGTRLEPVPEDSSKSDERHLAHILLIDDEPVLRRVASKTLEMDGHTVTAFESGAKAIEYYRKNWQSVDIVILDIIMPQMDGEETFSILQQINPNINVLVSSGFSVNDKVRRMMQKGVKGFIKKPYRAQEMVQAILDTLTGVSHSPPFAS